MKNRPDAKTRTLSQAQGHDVRSLHYMSPEAERRASAATVEIALLLTICSSDTEVCSLAMQCCGAHALFRAHCPPSSHDEIQEWTGFYAELADPSFVQTGKCEDVIAYRRAQAVTDASSYE